MVKQLNVHERREFAWIYSRIWKDIQQISQGGISRATLMCLITYDAICRSAPATPDPLNNDCKCMFLVHILVYV